MVTTREGATANSIEVVQDGVVSRGVLLDVARHRGVSWMEPGEAIMPDELKEIESTQGTKVQQGDIDGAAAAASKAKLMCLLSFVLGLISLIWFFSSGEFNRILQEIQETMPR